MRIIRLKVNKTVQPLLRQISRQLSIEDNGFTEDVYALFQLKGNGIPDEVRARKMAASLAQKHKRSESMVTSVLNKRRQLLKEIANLPYFTALCSVEKDPVAATSRLLATFRKLHYKARQTKCMLCSLRTQCDFGNQYGSRLIDPAKVIQPDLRKLVNNSCPSYPEMESNAAFAEAIRAGSLSKQPANAPVSNVINRQNPLEGESGRASSALDAMEAQLDSLQLDEDGILTDLDVDEGFNGPVYESPDSEGGGAGSFSTKFDGDAIVRITEKSADSLTQARLILFELGQKLDLALRATKSGKFSPVKNPAKSTTQSKIKSLKEITELQPSQHGLPDEVFEARSLKRDLVKVQNEEQDSRKQLLYVLVDSSASMTDLLTSNGGPLGLITKASIASVFSICLARRVRDDGGLFFLRFFDGSTGQLFCAKKREDFEAVILSLSLVSSTGGGTNICGAIQTAALDVAEAEKSDPLASAEILIVTDCQDRFSESQAKASARGLKVNILDVSGKGGRSRAKDSLKAISSNYYKVDETELDINKMVQLV